MRLSIHTNPNFTSSSTGRDVVGARETEECDEIAERLREAGAEVTIIDGPVQSSDSDFWLVFGPDLDWHLAAGPVKQDRLVVLNPDRDKLFDVAERLGIAAATYYVQVSAWQRDSSALIVRRDVARRLGGVLGPGAPYVMESEHYAAWRDANGSSMAARLVTYLRALKEVAQ